MNNLFGSDSDDDNDNDKLNINDNSIDNSSQLYDEM
jgi:hypothetical protein